jgi:hypothetical protein
MAAEREKPRKAASGRTTGEGHERSRLWAEGKAERHEAADLRARAAQQRRDRDRCYREHERRMLNRSIHRRRY